MTFYMTRPVSSLALCCLLCLPATSQVTSTETLLRQLDTIPIDRGVLGKLESLSDSRVIAALRGAFERNEAKEDKQAIAALLVRLGEKEAPYYYFLERFVEE